MGGFFFFIGLAIAGEGVVHSPCTKFIDSNSLPRLLSHFDFYRVMASREVVLVDVITGTSGFILRDVAVKVSHWLSQTGLLPQCKGFAVLELILSSNWRWLPNMSYSIIHL